MTQTQCVQRARSAGYSLSRKSAAMGSVISMWDDSSLYTSPCSRSGRKFKIFWSTISDWCKKDRWMAVSLPGTISTSDILHNSLNGSHNGNLLQIKQQNRAFFLSNFTVMATKIKRGPDMVKWNLMLSKSLLCLSDNTELWWLHEFEALLLTGKWPISEETLSDTYMMLPSVVNATKKPSRACKREEVTTIILLYYSMLKNCTRIAQCLIGS